MQGQVRGVVDGEGSHETEHTQVKYIDDHSNLPAEVVRDVTCDGQCEQHPCVVQSTGQRSHPLLTSQVKLESK